MDKITSHDQKNYELPAQLPLSPRDLGAIGTRVVALATILSVGQIGGPINLAPRNVYAEATYSHPLAKLTPAESLKVAEGVAVLSSYLEPVIGETMAVPKQYTPEVYAGVMAAHAVIQEKMNIWPAHTISAVKLYVDDQGALNKGPFAPQGFSRNAKIGAGVAGLVLAGLTFRYRGALVALARSAHLQANSAASYAWNKVPTFRSAS